MQLDIHLLKKLASLHVKLVGVNKKINLVGAMFSHYRELGFPRWEIYWAGRSVASGEVR